ncbi:DUF4160 domain-containing protein [Methylobacterium iners]|uniref:DUF4160 domain-containing protein n=1 Tax=Methylobacterium iners TaxID=418707 RepID=A0ABQ4RYR9_9HYPH|nr:DUF4160 domain-containing protein [Methylobacterium iners]GJD95530.1 hypothetical protein OCOJLMKI_2743 [Methylobacterium iners]
MPTLHRLPNCKIAIYADDHNPPHFHIEGKGWRVLVAIDGLRVLAGNPSKAGAAMDWAASNTALLRTEWQRLNRPRG